jgi:nitrogen fixation NifU-like protein
MDIYAENILDHYRHPRLKESLAEKTIEHTESNPTCGDTLTLQLLIQDDNVVSLGWSGDGCAISQAGMSILSEELIGKSVSDIEALQKKDIDALLGVPVGARRIKCELLALHTLKNTLHAWKKEPMQSWRETVGEEEN